MKRSPPSFALDLGFALLLLGGIGAAPAGASTCAVPEARQDGWEHATPEASGFDADALCALLEHVADSGENVHGIVVERHGKLVAELYRAGPDRPIDVLFGLWNPFGGDVDFGPETLHDVRSVSKSVIGLLVGILAARGELRVDAPVLDFYPELADLRTPERDSITLAHLLSMSSGLDWDEGALPNDETRLFWTADQARFVLDRAVVARPSSTFDYNSGGTAVLADVLVRASGTPLLDLARDELFAPLGIREWEWATDLRGRALAFTGLRMRPRDMARLGRLVLDEGRWNGTQIVPAGWIADSVRPRVRTDLQLPSSAPDALQYGYQWWLGSSTWRGTRLDWSAAFGNGGQRIFVVPALDLIVVLTAGAYGSGEISLTADRLLSAIVAAVKE